MSEERGGGAAHRALEHFEGELMFEGEWIPPTPFNGIAFLAAGAVLRHLHRRTQARGEPRARARPKRKKTRPDRPSITHAPHIPPAHPTTTDPRTPLAPASIARPRQRTESRTRHGAGGAGTATNGAIDGAVAERHATTTTTQLAARGTISERIRAAPSKQPPRPRPAGRQCAVSAAAMDVVGQTRRQIR